MLGNLVAWVRANRTRLHQTGLAFAAVWIWVSFVLLIINLYVIKQGVGADFVNKLYEEHLPLGLRSLMATSMAENFFWSLIVSCVAAPLMEEFFRGAACELCTDKETGRMKNPFVLYSLSCIGFGLLHGGGYISVLIQGSLGLMLGWLWFENAKGPDGKTDKTWAFFANVAVHAAYNFCVTGIQVMIIRSHM